MIEAAPDKPVEPVRRLVTKKIEEVRPGDVVVSRDERTGEITRQQVLDAYERVTDHLRVVEITGTDGETQRIETTNEHPFWVTNRGWVKAEDLSEGDPLEDSSGGVAWIASTTLEPHPEGIAVYNFQVDQTHTYFVRAHGIRGPPLFVHNAECAVNVGLGRRHTLDGLESSFRARAYDKLHDAGLAAEDLGKIANGDDFLAALRMSLRSERLGKVYFALDDLDFHQVGQAIGQGTRMGKNGNVTSKELLMVLDMMHSGELARKNVIFTRGNTSVDFLEQLDAFKWDFSKTKNVESYIELLRRY